MKSIFKITCLFFGGMLVFSCAIEEEEQAIDFNEDIRPILNAKCISCHGGVKKSGGFSVLFREEALAVTESGKPAIIPGQPENSEFIRRIRHTDPEQRMPMDAPPLEEKEIALLEKWITEGAKWKDHWAYVKPEPVTLPQVEDESWEQNEIDRFVLAKLEERNLTPNEEADCATLIRRLSLDLTGLPPTIEEISDFCQDTSQDAYEKVVDRLLRSPHFGERWASMWLDLARYADSKGYEKDGHREIWKYRDWVIDAFNKDLPFDQFTIDQLAGDLLPEPTKDQIIATAFHRNTMNNDEGGTDDEEFRVAAVLDRVSTTWEVWQGTTFACVQCHSHPYDPFKLEEFYEFYAFFNNTEDADRPSEQPWIEVYTKEQEKELESLKSWISGFNSSADDDVELRQKKAMLASIKPSTLPIMKELSQEKSRRTHVFERGNWLMHGKEVSPGVPASMPELPVDVPVNRLGMAKWLVSTANPLTARVTVNRFWAQLFGKGIVETQEDFGSLGQKPTHPMLLDWLARHFMLEQGWSMKRLLKLMVMSTTYKQSSHVDADLLEADPYNLWLARGVRVRLSAEQVRDQALAVSGLLSEKMFGPSVMPPQPEGIWQVVYNGKQWETSQGDDRYRRAMYTYWRRTSPYPSMVSFDRPSHEFCVSRRINTNTPLQALVTLNDPVYLEAAGALAKKMIQQSPDLDGQIIHGYQRALGHEPSGRVLGVLKGLYQDAIEQFKKDNVKGNALKEEALIVVSNAIMNLDEFVMKQ
ncbi:PSD1 and planctomycete cytochrome C domain-containing protein [Fulvivirgaceae bacterium BMA10]|uniref:PSD1 and planctomycete cytochrome C domain-containing protein n=1 Tax=Splendidivirga corallicola TaxID=3051826 RepID=A0ABT8KXI4_9BACT|nr:PSD1 and planctomycete cytochrome C domain-containing protein [Fulvivirgaceae bacterium BMA10]